MSDLEIYMDRAGYFAHEYRRIHAAATAMLDALEGLEAWEDDFGSKSITEAVWKARNNLKAATESETMEPHRV